ncbi:MAG: Z1 domain-containing protein [Acidimicrobiales bacterium]
MINATQWEPWYGQDRKVGRSFYWDALCGHLRDHAGWPEESIISLDESTDAVVARFADPLAPKQYQAKGLVVGYVQSGKTANITGVLAKAADVGYRLVIVLAGTLNMLRNQTQRRIDSELIGVELLEHEYDDDAELSSFIYHGGRPAELGAFDWTRLTTRQGEYHKLAGGAISALRFAAQDPNQPLNHPDNLYSIPARLLVVKKQANVLDRVAHDLARINTSGELEEVPALVIDDESDQASVNTVRPAANGEHVERRRINEAIVGLLSVLPRGQYVGYTATPFANVFVDPYDAADIFPRDFIVSLPRPVGYLGASDFHDLAGPPKGVDEQPILSNERAFVRPVYGDDEDAENLQRAIDSFLLAGAIKLFRQRADGSVDARHHTMMVHTSHLNADQREQLGRVTRQLSTGGYRTGTAAGRLRELLERDFQPVSAARASGLAFPSSFDELEGDLGAVLTRLHRGGKAALLVNSTKEADQLAFDTEPVWKIVVGGAKLSRGFTIEGLTTSYFRRRSPTADTLMQMGRWCGFRRGYADLVRLFIGRREPFGREVVDVYEAFEAICRTEEDFRAELAQYEMPQGGERPITPMNIPPLVSTYEEWIRPTSREKMFNARISFRNFGRRAVEHRRVAQDVDQKRHNESLVATILQGGPTQTYELSHAGGNYSLFGGSRSSAQVRELLGAYVFAERSPDLSQELEFLDGKDGDPAIEDWAVLLPQLERASERTWRFADRDLSVHRRGYWMNEKPLANAFTGPEIRAVGEAIAGVRDVEQPSPDLRSLRSQRRAVLLVYPITHEPPNERDWVPTMGLTLQFPANEIPQRIGFAVRSPADPDEPVVDVTD